MSMRHYNRSIVVIRHGNNFDLPYLLKDKTALNHVGKQRLEALQNRFLSGLFFATHKLSDLQLDRFWNDERYWTEGQRTAVLWTDGQQRGALFISGYVDQGKSDVHVIAARLQQNGTASTEWSFRPADINQTDARTAVLAL